MRRPLTGRLAPEAASAVYRLAADPAARDERAPLGPAQAAPLRGSEAGPVAWRPPDLGRGRRRSGAHPWRLRWRCGWRTRRLPRRRSLHRGRTGGLRPLRQRGGTESDAEGENGKTVMVHRSSPLVGTMRQWPKGDPVASLYVRRHPQMQGPVVIAYCASIGMTGHTLLLWRLDDRVVAAHIEAEKIETLLHVRRQGGGDIQRLSGAGVRHDDAPGQEVQPVLNAAGQLPVLHIEIFRIADDGMPDVSRVSSELVGAARHGLQR